MTAEVSPELGAPSQTIETFRAAADMFLIGKDVATKSLNTFPFLPDIVTMADSLVANINLTKLTENERAFLLTDGYMKTYALLKRRAMYQSRHFAMPEIVSKQLLLGLEAASENNLRFKPERVTFKWSLFSVSMVLPQPEFDAVAEYQYGKRQPGLKGFVGFFGTEIGRMPFVLKGSNNKHTGWHEDVHVFREEMGISFPFRHDMQQIVQMPSVARAAENENIQPQDLNIHLELLDQILSDDQQVNREELAASLWVGNVPTIGDIDDPHMDTDLSFIWVNTVNCLYAPATNLNEEQILEKHYEVNSKISELAVERTRMYKIAKQAISQYKGNKNPWGLAAARATVVPPWTSQRFYEAVMLGRNERLKDEPEVDKGMLLATVMITHIRRLTLPDAYGQGGPIPDNLLEIFRKKIAQVINTDKKYLKILESRNFTQKDRESTKSWLIRFAKSSIPSGNRSALEKELKDTLSI